jgi:conjugative transfer region protein TrbK
MTQSRSLQALVWGAALIIFFGAAILVGRDAPKTTPAQPATSSADPALARCRAAGQAALDDPACRRTWDGARARFFGHAPEGRS